MEIAAVTPADARRARGGAARHRRAALSPPASVPSHAARRQCSKGQVQAWALNRYYYQAMIPLKDAGLIARCDDPALRRDWRQRLVDHDGERDGRWRHRALAQAHRRARARSRLRHVDARAPAGDTLRGRRLRALRARADAARGDRLVADRDVLADDHRRARGGHARELRFRHARDARLFRQAPAAGAARRRLRARLREASTRARPRSSRRCSTRSTSSATCCGRSSTRSTTPMSRRGTCRPAPSCRTGDSLQTVSALRARQVDIAGQRRIVPRDLLLAASPRPHRRARG